MALIHRGISLLRHCQLTIYPKELAMDLTPLQPWGHHSLLLPLKLTHLCTAVKVIDHCFILNWESNQFRVDNILCIQRHRFITDENTTIQDRINTKSRHIPKRGQKPFWEEERVLPLRLVEPPPAISTTTARWVGMPIFRTEEEVQRAYRF